MSRITQIHGWIHILYTYKSTEEADREEESHIKGVVRQIERWIEEENFLATDVRIVQTYGENFLSICGFKWHYDECSQVISLYQKISDIAKGSYGLLYIRSEVYKEDNVFKVIVLKKGTIIEQEDPFLSPCIPEIEDPFL